jgi:pimeloyl-ACP methyl ester carboxylesterase
VTIDDTAADELSLLEEEARDAGLPWTGPPLVARREVGTGDGSALSALVWGEGSPRLALLHGGGLNAHTWDTTALALDRPLVALDLPGHGDSPWRDDADYRAETIAAPVGAALEQAAPEADAIVGQSLGGLTAIAVAASHRHLVRRLVLVDISPGFVIEGGNPVRDFLADAESFASRAEIVDRALSFGFGPTRRAVERGVLHNTRARDDGRVVFKHHLANLGGRAAPFSLDFRPLWPALEGAGVPVLLVRGTRGFVSDALADELTARIPDARVVTLDTGHNVQEDAPVALAREIARFVDATP